jgi:hypothetical protein
VAKSGVVWDRPPEVLQQAIGSYGELVKDRVGAFLVMERLEAQNWMRANRLWRDISGNARRGLRVEVVKRSEQWIMFFIHSVDYGKWLELKNAGKYAVIAPGVRRTVPNLKRGLRGLAD